MIQKISQIKKILVSLLLIIVVFSLSACSSEEEEKIPVVTCGDNGVTVNGKVIYETGNNISVNRIDSSVVSLSVGSTVSRDGSVNISNVDPQGNEIKLSDVITDRDLYESIVSERLSNDITISVRNSVDTGPEVDREKMKEVLCSYDKAMALPFIMGYNGVSIIYTDENGASDSVTINYDSGLISEKYVPGDGVICRAWMTGRVGYEISGMKLDGYVDHWAENSLQIDNYNGHTYYWFCVAYKDEEENKTYYSVVAEEDDEGDKAI